MATGEASGDTSDRPPLEDKSVPAATDGTATEPAETERQPSATPTEPDVTPEPATENEKSETPAEAR